MDKVRVRARTPAGLELYRDQWGVPHVHAANEHDLYWGMGWFHARDRGLQMLLFRILGRGEGCRHLEDSEEMLAVDVFFRRAGWHRLDRAVEDLDPSTRALIERYVAGVNEGLRGKTPWELRLVGYRPEPWTVHDCLLLARMTGYLTLAQSQGEIERLVVELVQAGVDRERLEELFPGRLEGLDLELVRRVQLGERVVPSRVRWQLSSLRMMASNNWVVAGSRTSGGAPILCNDPHLEINRLPNVWAEQVLRTRERWFCGATMPGLPAMLLGRTAELAWGATYAFMDATDSWIEECRDGKCRRGDDWVELPVREEVIVRKKHPSVTVRVYENEHGVLDGDPHQAGHYLATRWSGAEIDGVSMQAFADLFSSTTVEQGMRSLGRMQAAFNWVFADRSGGIGYQMSGSMPRRRAGWSGLVPLPGWDPANDWQGYWPPEQLPRERDPERGFIVTANQDLNHLGEQRPINACMADYRARRIADMLEQGSPLAVTDMQRIQSDLYSIQAHELMTLIEPLLPVSENARILREWDRCYGQDSMGASLFERFYTELLRELFARNLGEEVFAYLHAETGVFIDFYDAVDRLIERERSPWYDGRTRDEVFAAALARALAGPARPWGQQREIVLTNLFFAGRLPRALGFDRGPIRLPGGRATVFQCQIYRSAGRLTSFGPSVRIIAAMDQDCIHTNLIGGPSDRRFSAWYASDLRRWLDGEYKTLEP